MLTHGNFDLHFIGYNSFMGPNLIAKETRKYRFGIYLRRKEMDF